MKKITSFILIIISIIFTAAVSNIDIQPIGLKSSEVGFAAINQFVFDVIGVSMAFYHITDWLGVLPVAMALIYALVGATQLIKRRSIKKVDTEIILLGVFYIIVFALYIFFNKFIVNYRPILIDGFLEASYPSSHTMIVLFLCGSAMIVNKKLIASHKIENIIRVFLIIIALITVIGRILSGVHWITDIIGGLIIAAALLSLFRWLVDRVDS